MIISGVNRLVVGVLVVLALVGGAYAAAQGDGDGDAQEAAGEDALGEIAALEARVAELEDALAASRHEDDVLKQRMRKGAKKLGGTMGELRVSLGDLRASLGEVEAASDSAAAKAGSLASEIDAAMAAVESVATELDVLTNRFDYHLRRYHGGS